MFAESSGNVPRRKISLLTMLEGEPQPPTLMSTAFDDDDDHDNHVTKAML